MTDEEIIDYILSILNGSKKEATQMRECVAKTAICQRLNASIEFMQKLNTRLARLNVVESGDMDATIKQNPELKEIVSRAGYRIAELKHEVDELKAHCKAVDDVNTKLRCCGNCKLGAHGSALCRTCYDYRNWELSE